MVGYRNFVQANVSNSDGFLKSAKLMQVFCHNPWGRPQNEAETRSNVRIRIAACLWPLSAVHIYEIKKTIIGEDVDQNNN